MHVLFSNANSGVKKENDGIIMSAHRFGSKPQKIIVCF